MTHRRVRRAGHWAAGGGEALDTAIPGASHAAFDGLGATLEELGHTATSVSLVHEFNRPKFICIWGVPDFL